MAIFVPKYPLVFDTNSVKATSYYSSSYYPWFAIDPSLQIINASANMCWLSSTATFPQKLKTDLGVEYVIDRISFVNYHTNGSATNAGVKNFNLYGTNSATAFNNTTGSDVTDLTLLGSYLALEHTANATQEVLQYFDVVGAGSFRYYVVIITDSYGSVSYVGLRKITFFKLQEVVDTYTRIDPYMLWAYKEQKFHITKNIVPDFIAAYNVWKRSLKSILASSAQNTFICATPDVIFIDRTDIIKRTSTTYNNGDLTTNVDGYIEGTVTVSGTVWPNVKVRLYYNVDGLLIDITKSDENGYFRFNTLEIGKSYYTVVAFKEGFNAIIYDRVPAAGTLPPVVLPPPPPPVPEFWTPDLVYTDNWFTVNELATVEESVDGVAAWRDKSSNNRDAIQLTPSRQPSLTIDGILFDGITQTLRITGPKQSLQNIYIVLKSLDDIFVVFGSGSQAWYGVAGEYNRAVETSANFGNPIITNDGIYSPWTDRVQVYTALYNKFSILCLEGVELQSWNFMDLFYYDAAYPQFNMKGIIKELVILPSSATAYDRVVMEGYLAWEHDLTANLPVDHSFRNVKPYNCIPVYPASFDLASVVSSTVFSSNYAAHYAADPSKNLLGALEGNCFIAGSGALTLPQKFNMAYAEPFIPNRIYIENSHNSGGTTSNGIKTLEIYGSNSYTAFVNVDGNDMSSTTYITTITVPEHIPYNMSSPNIFTFDNENEYQYMICRITGYYAPQSWFGIRRIVFERKL